jgi:hypothetical protein
MIDEIDQLVTPSTGARMCGFQSRQAFSYAVATDGPDRVLIDGQPFFRRDEIAEWNNARKRRRKSGPARPRK